MRTTWRTLAWNYGHIVWLGNLFLALPVLVLAWGWEDLGIPHWVASVACVVGLATSVAALAVAGVWSQYLRQCDLPEWKESHPT